MSPKFLSFASPRVVIQKNTKSCKRIRLGKGSSLVPCFVVSESEALLSCSHGNVESVAAHMDLKFQGGLRSHNLGIFSMQMVAETVSPEEIS